MTATVIAVLRVEVIGGSPTDAAAKSHLVPDQHWEAGTRTRSGASASKAGFSALLWEGDLGELLSRLEDRRADLAWLREHQASLELDLGLTVSSNIAVQTFSLSHLVLAFLAELAIDVAVSIYITDDGPGTAEA